MKTMILILLTAQLVFAAIGRHHRCDKDHEGDVVCPACCRDSSYLNHVQLVHQFRCSLPQPRAVPVEELLTVGPSPDEIFYPASTVLARCAGSGCCPDAKQVCAPVETRNISLVFAVKHRIDQQRDRHHEIIHAIEHTKCGCLDRVVVEST